MGPNDLFLDGRHDSDGTFYHSLSSTIEETMQAARPLLWLVATSLSLASSKRLQEDGFHYPMHLLVLHLVATLFQRSVQSVLQRYKAGPDPAPSQLPIRLAWTHLVIFACGSAHALSVAASLVYGYQTVLLSRHLALVIMILAPDWQLLNVEANILERRSWPETDALHDSAFKVALRLLGVVLLFEAHFTINERDTKTLLGALGFSVLAQLMSMLGNILQSETATNDDNSARWSSPSNGLSTSTWTLLCSTVLATVGIYKVEPPGVRGHYLPLPSVWLLVINVFASAIALDRSPALFRYGECLREHDARASRTWFGYCLQSGVVLPTILVGLTMCFTKLLCHQPPSASLAQCLGFLLATFASSSRQDMESLISITREARLLLRSGNSRKAELVEGGQRVLSISSKILLWIMLVCSLAIWTAVLMWHAPTSEMPSPKHALLDRAYQAQSPLDLVVSRFAETREEVLEALSDLLTTSELRVLRPRIFIYDKASNLDQNVILLMISREIYWLWNLQM